MSSLAEQTIFRLLVDRDSIDTLTAEGFESSFLPTEELRNIYSWAIEYYRNGHRVVAPTVSVFKETRTPSGYSYYDMLSKYDISLDAVLEEELPTIEWAMEQLKAQWITNKAGDFSRGLASDIMASSAADRVSVLSD